MAESYSVEAVLSATDKNFSKTMKGAVGSVDSMNSGILSSISGLGSKISSGLGTALKVGITTAFAGAAATAAAGGAMLVKSMNLAGDLEQNLGGSEAVFEQYASGLQNTAKDAYKNMGLSTSEYLSVANKMGSLFQGAGFDVKQSMDLSSSAMQRASDVASIMGVDQSTAMEAVAGAAKGNFTMMDNLGVAMNDTSIAAYAVSKGINKSTAEMTSQEKTGLAMQMFMEKTAKYAGNYAKENDTLAGSLGTAKSALSNFMATGENIDDVISSGMQFAKVAGKMAMELAPKLFKGIASAVKDVIPKLPSAFAALQEGVSNVLRQAFGDGAATAFDGFMVVLKTVANTIGSVAKIIKNNFSIITAAVTGVVAGLMAFKTVIAVIKAVTAVTKAYAVAQSILNGTLAVNPIMILIAAIVALVAAFVYLWQTNEGFRNAIINTWNAIKEFMVPIVESIGNIVKVAMDTILLVVQTVLNAIKTVWSEWGTAIMAVVSMVWNVVQSIFTLVISNILSYLTAAFNTMKVVVETVLGVIQGIIKVVTGLIKGDWSQVWGGIKQIFSSVWNGIKSIVDTTINLVKSIISNTWNAIKSITSSVWEGIKQILSSVWNGINSIVDTAINLVKNIISNTWNAIKSITSSVWESIKSAITTPIEAAKAKVQSVVDGIKNILMSLGDIDLQSAGRAIVDGFLRGLTSAFESVKSTVGGWANWIKEHKGPISYDKRLLIGNGKAIVYGLNKGLKSGFNTVKSTVYDLTNLIATGADKINTELSNFDINIPQMDSMALAYSSSSNSQFNGNYDYNSKIEVHTEVISNLDGQKVGYGTAKYVDEANQKNAQRKNFVEGK